VRRQSTCPDRYFQVPFRVFLLGVEKMAKNKRDSFGDLLVTAEVAKELGISISRVQILIGEGRLPAKRMGAIWVVRKEDLELVRHRPTGRPPKNPNGKSGKKK
jgi:excisionase family DNA binding protein